MLTDRTGESEGNRIDYPRDARRQRWADRVASFACGFATLTLLPLAMSARPEYELSLPALAGVIVASLMLGAGLRLHLRFAAERFGETRVRGILLAVLSWSIAAMGAVSWGRQYLALQLFAGVVAAAVIVLGAPGLPALLGAVMTAVVVPPMFKSFEAAGFGREGAGAMVTSSLGVFLALLAAAAYALAKPATSVIDPAPDAEPQAPEMRQVPAATAA